MIRRIALTLTAAALSAPLASAWESPGRRHRPTHLPKPPGKVVMTAGRHIARIPHGAISIGFGESRFYFHAGIFYRWKTDGYVVVSPPVGMIVPVLPVGCRVEVIAGETYYILHGTHYRRIHGGYIVLRDPESTVVVATPPPAPPQSQNYTVWIRNTNGSRTPVVLTPAEGGQWIGPKGEYYPDFPTEEQLKPVYGLSGDASETISDANPVRETLWIVNTNGSKTPVELEKQDNGSWQGPSGEIYDKLPTEAELRATYGLQNE